MNFRCPFCGDSKKNRHKTRAYVYQVKDYLSFKCHNCNLSCSLDKLISFVDPVIHKQYRLEKYRDSGNKPGATFVIPKENPTTTTTVKAARIDLKLPRLSELPPTNPAVEYAKLRMLPRNRWDELFYCSNMKSLEYLNAAYKDRLPEEGRLIIPFHGPNGEITGITGRAISPSPLRYITMRISEEPLIYGRNHVDFNSTVYVTEGQIDSMFVVNAVAAGGTDFDRVLRGFYNNNVVLIFDNQPRNKQVVHKLESMVPRGHGIVVWGKDWKFKDINEAIMAGMSTIELMSIIHNNTYSGLSLKLAIRDWKKI